MSSHRGPRDSTRHRSRALAVGVLVVALAGAGCTIEGSDETPAATRSPGTDAVSPSQLPTPTGSARTPTVPPPRGTAASPTPDAPAALPPAGMAGSTADGSGPPTSVTDVDVIVHDDYDRVVLTVGGAGTPGWRAQYVRAAFEQGSGRRLEIAGEAVLEINLTNTGYPQDTGVGEYDGPDRIGEDGIVREIVYRGVFEGITQVLVGVADQGRPFRVFSLDSPPRVVIDVLHDD